MAETMLQEGECEDARKGAGDEVGFRVASKNVQTNYVFHLFRCKLCGRNLKFCVMTMTTHIR